MLEIWLIILSAGALLAVAGVMAYRRRRAVSEFRDDDDEEPRDVAPLLYLPQRNHTPEPQMPLRAVQAVAPPPARRALEPSYIAPLSGTGVDATLQLWPGRLEPLNGADQEIRFIRTPGSNRFTFGRSKGPAHSHIQLLAATASRMHAYMIIEDGRWRIGNMSQTNRVLVNGDPLESTDADRWLADGDRIELGEVGFIFRER